MGPFAGVSEMSLAPVSVGNSVRSSKQNISIQGDVVRVIGRDYVSTVGGTSAAFSGWTFQTGLGLSPIALNASGLRGFFQSYQKYKWNRADAHYITSSPTSLAGDILLFHHANHGGPKVDHTSSNFLSYAMSTDNALIGPQWTNHSIRLIDGTREWFDTDVLNAEDVQHQADGELLVYTKNTTNGTAPDPPGYLLIDYDISFKSRMLNSRVQTLPSGLFKWNPACAEYGAGPVVAGDVFRCAGTGTSNYTGVANTAFPGIAVGDVFQVVFDLSNATTTNFSFVTGVNYMVSLNTAANTGIYANFPIATGTTVYAQCTSAASGMQFCFFPTYPAVFAGSPLRFATSATPTFTCALQYCCVGSSSTVYTQANIG
jgi:hypothetical protein